MTSADRPIVAVGAIVTRDDSLLMVRRGNDPGRGLWSIPGGRVDAGEYIADAVAREVREETGVDVDVGTLAGILEIPGTPHYIVLDFVATTLDDAEPKAGEDADEARWIPFGEIESLECTPRLVETLTAWKVLTSAGEESD